MTVAARSEARLLKHSLSLLRRLRRGSAVNALSIVAALGDPKSNAVTARCGPVWLSHVSCLLKHMPHLHARLLVILETSESFGHRVGHSADEKGQRAG